MSELHFSIGGILGVVPVGGFPIPVPFRFGGKKPEKFHTREIYEVQRKISWGNIGVEEVN